MGDIKLKYSKKRRFGNCGEDFACLFLISKKYKIITRNYYKKRGEIDIIASKGRKIHFVEVKTVSRETYKHARSNANNNFKRHFDDYRPEDNVSKKKMLHMRHAIRIFISENNLFNREIQIDVITVTFKKGRRAPTFNFIENIIF